MEKSSGQRTMVLMPWQDETVIKYTETKSSDTRREINIKRCDLIEQQLNSPVQIQNFEMFRDMVKSYNPFINVEGQQLPSLWEFKTLKVYISELTAGEKNELFKENGILWTIKHLAASMRHLVDGVHLLKKDQRASVTLHQLQVASILANGFLCTFPRRSNMNYPRFNFDGLFEGLPDKKISRQKSMVEKIKCLVHYFKRVRDKQPTGNVTYKRLSVPDDRLPRFDKTNCPLNNMTFDSVNKIEDFVDYLQVDFANKYVGGGVLRTGCVQEEIRFVICPELIVSRLFTECLSDCEALLVSGVERFSNYKGYSNTFEFAGDYDDETKIDSRTGHRSTQVLMLDALKFNNRMEQYREGRILRELKKVYVGFQPTSEEELNKPIATGNWGCGAFKGDPSLKCLLQLMAASEVGRHVLYCTFDDVELERSLSDMVDELTTRRITVGQALKDYFQNPSSSSLSSNNKTKAEEKTRNKQTSGSSRSGDNGKYPRLDVTTVKGKQRKSDDEDWLEMYSGGADPFTWFENEKTEEMIIDGDDSETRKSTAGISLQTNKREIQEIRKTDKNLSQSKITNWFAPKQV